MELAIGLLGCRELLPDVWDLMDHLREALGELREETKPAPGETDGGADED